MAITNISGFKSEQECVTAGKRGKSLAEMTTKAVKFVCIAQSK